MIDEEARLEFSLTEVKGAGATFGLAGRDRHVCSETESKVRDFRAVRSVRPVEHRWTLRRRQGKRSSRELCTCWRAVGMANDLN